MVEVQCTVTYKDIAGFPGYRVGDDGSVWNAWITCRSGRRLTDRWKRLKPATTRKGYRSVNLTPPGEKYRTLRVHRLVLESFVGPCPDGMECRHLNGEKADNRLGNLAWGTAEDNRDDNRRLDAYQSGESHTQVKLTAEQVRAMRARRAAGEPLKVLARDFGVGVPNVSVIVNRRSWKHLD